MTDQLLRHLNDRGIHRIVMDDGANALDPPLLEALTAKVGELKADGAPPMMLASSHPSLFCPGWDLKLLASADREQVKAVLTAFNRLVFEIFSYPGPTAAAVTGHAVAGGCLLALSCDLRVMASGRPRIGFAELNLGVPVPAAGIRMVRARGGVGAYDEAVFSGDGCAAELACELGLVHRVAPVAQVAVVADNDLRKLGSKSQRAYAATKEFMFGEDWRAMARDSSRDDDVFLDCWFDDETQARIARVVQQLGK
jgi:enoyl-CoA hydratase